MTMMLIVWAAMTATGLLLVEASLWFEEGAHMVTMATRLLGPSVRFVAWTLYLYICYASLVAYTSAGGDLLSLVTEKLGSFSLHKLVSCSLFVAAFGSVLYLGNSIVGRVNTILFVGMMAAFAILLLVGLPEVKLSLLQRQSWKGVTLAMPLLLTTFSFQTIVPSLTPYLGRDVARLRKAITGGTTIALMVYTIWQTMVLGMIPLEGLQVAQEGGLPATHMLMQVAGDPRIQGVASFFAFFALVTSFLAIAMGLFDFLSDAFSIPRKGSGELILAAAVLLPTLFFAVAYERAFLVALDTSGGIGDSILNGIIPVIMIWRGRYRRGYEGVRGIEGGRPILFIIGAFYLFVAIQEILVLSGGADLVGNYLNTLDY
jgi:tyrosine-specific transport protein